MRRACAGRPGWSPAKRGVAPRNDSPRLVQFVTVDIEPTVRRHLQGFKPFVSHQRLRTLLTATDEGRVEVDFGGDAPGTVIWPHEAGRDAERRATKLANRGERTLGQQVGAFGVFEARHCLHVFGDLRELVLPSRQSPVRRLTPTPQPPRSSAHLVTSEGHRPREPETAPSIPDSEPA